MLSKKITIILDINRLKLTSLTKIGDCRNVFSRVFYVVYLAFPLWFDLQFFYATTQNLSMASRAGENGGMGEFWIQWSFNILVVLEWNPVLLQDLLAPFGFQTFRRLWKPSFAAEFRTVVIKNCLHADFYCPPKVNDAFKQNKNILANIPQDNVTTHCLYVSMAVSDLMNRISIHAESMQLISEMR